MKSWEQEVEEYREKIKGMEESEAYRFLWKEYTEHRISKRAHDWLVMWI